MAGKPQDPIRRFYSKLAPGRLVEGMSTPCIEWQAGINEGGYGRYNVWDGARNRGVLAHRYALEMVGQFSDLPVMHLCDNPPCCNVEHLRYATYAENSADMVRKNRHTPGERRYNARLTDALVLQMRQEVEAGRTIASLAAEIGISESAAQQAVRGLTWKHLPQAVAS